MLSRVDQVEGAEEYGAAILLKPRRGIFSVARLCIGTCQTCCRKNKRGEDGAGYERIDALFDIERDINSLSAEERLRVRQEQSAPLLAALEARLREEHSRLSRSASVAQPIDYMLKRWDRFARFIEDGRSASRTMQPSVLFEDLRWGECSSPVPSAALTGRRP